MGDIDGPGSFRAFLSYSHADERQARRLHRALETYRLPRRLRAGADGRLTPIFRDRDELPAGQDLSATIQSALARSEALIVLCSPAAQASQWVAREIELFRQLHPDRPIFAALLDGEPADAFPALLRADPSREPIAADFRKQGDGRRLALLKLVAGLTGVELDALVQRDAQRQVRRVMAVTLIALAAVLVMAALLVLALNARREADRQRREAEGMVEFMLTDLRTKLKGVGNLGVMETVNRRALAYYGDPRALSGLPDDSLERRARVLHAMGEDDLTRGAYPSALAWFNEAHVVTAATLARHPNDAAAIFAHAQSEYWIGRVYELRGEWGSVKPYYQRYAEAGRRLVTIDPANPDYMMERGWGPRNLGAVAQYGDKDIATAERLFREAAAWFDRAARARPGDVQPLSALADTQGWLADSYYGRSAWSQALQSRRVQYDIYRRLAAKAPDDQDLVFKMAAAERSLGHTALMAGKRADALRYFASGYARTQKLVRADPANGDWLLMNTLIECELLAEGPTGDRPRLTTAIRGAAAAFRARNDPKIEYLKGCAAL